MFAGVAILAVAVGVAWLGEGAANYAGGLVLLGVGWNFLFTAGSTLITTTYRPLRALHRPRASTTSLRSGPWRS